MWTLIQSNCSNTNSSNCQRMKAIHIHNWRSSPTRNVLSLVQSVRQGWQKLWLHKSHLMRQLKESEKNKWTTIIFHLLLIKHLSNPFLVWPKKNKVELQKFQLRIFRVYQVNCSLWWLQSSILDATRRRNDFVDFLCFISIQQKMFFLDRKQTIETKRSFMEMIQSTKTRTMRRLIWIENQFERRQSNGKLIVVLTRNG